MSLLTLFNLEFIPGDVQINISQVTSNGTTGGFNFETSIQAPNIQSVGVVNSIQIISNKSLTDVNSNTFIGQPDKMTQKSISVESCNVNIGNVLSFTNMGLNGNYITSQIENIKNGILSPLNNLNSQIQIGNILSSRSNFLNDIYSTTNVSSFSKDTKLEIPSVYSQSTTNNFIINRNSYIVNNVSPLNQGNFTKSMITIGLSLDEIISNLGIISNDVKIGIHSDEFNVYLNDLEDLIINRDITSDTINCGIEDIYAYIQFLKISSMVVYFNTINNNRLNFNKIINKKGKF